MVYKRQWHRISACIKSFTVYWPRHDGNHWYWYCWYWMTIDRLCIFVVVLCGNCYSKTLLFFLFLFFFFTYKNKLKLQRNGSKKIKVRFTVYIRPCNFLVDSCIRSLGLLDEWALPFMQKCTMCCWGHNKYSFCPFLFLNTNPELTLALSVTHY